MLASPIGWILALSGLATGGAGLAAAALPVKLLRAVFGVAEPEPATLFFVRHWGVLIAVVGALIALSAGAPQLRPAVLGAGVVEKAAVVVLVLFGPLDRTAGMTAAAAFDGILALAYVAILAGG
jgi:hypothetical protein